MKIALDFGHGFGDSGALGCGKREDNCTREIGEKVKYYLEKEGQVINIVSTDGSLTNRCNRANNWGAELYVSIHLNAFNGQAYGTETHIYGKGGRAEAYATRVNSKLAGLGFTNRGVKISNFQVLRNTNMAAILIECCFIDNQGDMNKYNPDKLGKAIAEGILNKNINDVVVTPTPAPPSTNNIYRIFHNGQQQGTAYANVDNILKSVREGLEKGLDKIELIKK